MRSVLTHSWEKKRMIELFSVFVLSFAAGYYVCYKYNDAIDQVIRDIGNK